MKGKTMQQIQKRFLLEVCNRRERKKERTQGQILFENSKETYIKQYFAKRKKKCIKLNHSDT